MKNKKNYIIYALIIIAISTLIYSMLSFFNFPRSLYSNSEKTSEAIRQNPMGSSLSRMSFTGFDLELAKQNMDKDNDGMCDFCGMPVKNCIDAGEMQCTMDPKSTIGKLGSQHIHADLKIYINEVKYDFSSIVDRHERQMQGDTTVQDTSAFIHIESANLPEKAGNLLHMHATGVPLWLFFRSLGIEFNDTCLVLPNNANNNQQNNEQFCNTKNKKLKFYINNQPSNEFGKYVFKDLDKILISYGEVEENQKNINAQLSSITDYAKNH